MKSALLAGVVAGTIAMASGAHAAMGMAEVRGTAPDSTLRGTVHFEDTKAGLKVRGQLMYVPPGQHAFHIHEFGGCGDTGKAAGAHYNPADAPHGQVAKDGVHKAHAGDLGNISADKTGAATIEVTIPDVTLAGSKYTVGGRAVIVHEKVDDFSQPAGNAGGRIGCGPIIIIDSGSDAAAKASK